jgi:hypothetical protein
MRSPRPEGGGKCKYVQEMHTKKSLQIPKPFVLKITKSIFDTVRPVIKKYKKMIPGYRFVMINTSP